MRILVLLAVLLVLARPAHAQSTGVSTLEAVAYVAPAMASGICLAVNITMLAYDEGLPAGWRPAGYITGGVEVAVGAGLLIFAHDKNGGVALGTISATLGVATVVTTLLAKHPDDTVGPVAVPWFSPEGGGVAVTGRF